MYTHHFSLASSLPVADTGLQGTSIMIYDTNSLCYHTVSTSNLYLLPVLQFDVHIDLGLCVNV